MGLKTIRKITLSSFFYRIIMVLLFVMTGLGLLRLKGEYFVRKMYYSKSCSNNAMIIQNAKAALSSLYSIDGTSIPISWYLGNAYANMNDVIDAQACFLEAYKQNPYNRNVLNDLGSSYVMRGKSDSGLYYYNQAARISPRFDDPKLNMTAVYFSRNKLNEAKTCLDSIYHNSDRRNNYYDILKIRIAEGNGN